MRVHAMGPDIMDLSGSQFGEWSVLHIDTKKGNNWYWMCRCSCGNEQSVNGSKLNTGQTSKCKSCTAKENGRKGLYKLSENVFLKIR